MSQSNNKSTSSKTKRSLSGRNLDSKTPDLYQPYKLPRQHLKYGSPSEIIRQLSRLPKSITQPERETTQPKKSTPAPPPTPTPLPTIKPLIQKPKQLTAVDLRQIESKFSQLDYEKALEKPDIQVSFYHRKHRHDEDDGDTLSEITDRTTLSFSRFDRVFKDKRNHVLSPETRVLETQLQSQQSSPKQHEANELKPAEQAIELKPAEQAIELKPAEQAIELKPADEPQTETLEPIIPPALIELPFIEQDQDIPLQEDFAIEDDGLMMNMDYDEEEEASVEDAYVGYASTEQNAALYDHPPMEDAPVMEASNVEEMITEPRQKAIIQGSSFIRRRIQEARPSPNVFSPAFTRSMFTNKLDHRLNLRFHGIQDITNLFFDQMADDLNNYKDNQPVELQDEITEEDMLLLMKRQRLIKDNTCLESLIHKYFPSDYSDYLCQSALADNILYPQPDQELQDMTSDAEEI